MNEKKNEDFFSRFIRDHHIAIFFLVATLLCIGTPSAMMGFQIGPKWRMFHGYQRNFCAARFFDENDQRIDRYEDIGLKRHEAKGYYLHPQTEYELKRSVRIMCDRGAFETIRVEQACGSEGGWVPKDPWKHRCARKKPKK